MADEAENPVAGASTSTAVAVRPQRIVVQSHVAIMDTARFEHLGRVATVMTNAQIMPDSITRVGGKPDAEFLSYETIQARAFLIASWADRQNMDAHSVAQETSFVYNRLMQSGKLVDAAIQNALGYEFETQWGAWDVAKNRFVEGEPGEGKLLAVRVVAVDENGEIIVNKIDGKPKSVEGYVGGWETTKQGSPWTAPSGWRRMLRNRGIREWARAYKSGVMLGVYTPEDRWEEPEDSQEAATPKSRKKDLRAALAAPQAGEEGFTPESFKAGMNGDVVDSDGVVTEASDASDAKEEAKPADSKPPVEDKPKEAITPRDDINGPAPADVEYLMGDLVPNEKGRYATFKNGALFSTCTASKAGTLARYTMHPTTGPQEPAPPAENGAKTQASDLSQKHSDTSTTANTAAQDGGATGASPSEDDGFPGDRPAPGASDDRTVEEIAEDWEPMERHEGPAPRGVEYTLSTDEIDANDTVQAYEDGEPTRRVELRDFVNLPEYEAHPEPPEEIDAELVEDDAPTFFQELAAETSWLTVKPKLTQHFNSEDFKAFEKENPGAAERVRSRVWNEVVLPLKDKHRDPVDQAADVTAFRIWMATQFGEEGAINTEGTYRTLKAQPAYKKLKEDTQMRLDESVSKACKKMRGA